MIMLALTLPKREVYHYYEQSYPIQPRQREVVVHHPPPIQQTTTSGSCVHVYEQPEPVGYEEPRQDKRRFPESDKNILNYKNTSNGFSGNLSSCWL